MRKFLQIPLSFLSSFRNCRAAKETPCITKKHFVCLANSIKYQGRCVAGVEITFDAPGRFCIVKSEAGHPQWIRPVSHEKYGTLPERGTQNIALFDILEIENVVNVPKHAHSENVFYSSLKRSGKRAGQNTSHLNDLCTPVQPFLFSNKGKAISVEVFQESEHSLMFISVSNCMFYKDETDFFRDRFRVRFLYNAVEYDLPITDPVFINRLKTKGWNPDDSKKYRYYLTVSLSEEYRGWHYKLVAGVVEVRDDGKLVQNVF